MLRLALICLPFVGALAWSWRVYDLVHQIPGYGDVLESLWAIEWYRHTLFDLRSLPLFNPAVFFPNGWHNATWANGMLIYWVGAAIAQITGSAALAFNLLDLAPFVVSYAGSIVLLRRHGGLLAAVIGSLLFTFWEFHWLQIAGHPQVSWCIGLLPWLVINLEDIHQAQSVKHLGWLRAGLVWGLMIHATLYGIFWGGMVFALFVVRWLRQPRRYPAVALVVGVAGLIAAPLLILYVQGIRADQTVNLGILHARNWSASLNSLVAPNIVSPFEWVQSIATFIYSGRKDESSLANFGILMWLIVGIGCITVWRTRREAWPYVALIAISLALSMGPILTWNGDPVQIKSLQAIHTLNAGLWRMGHWARPDQFVSLNPPVPFADGLPLPGYLFYAWVPFSESARTLSRYMLVGMLGCTVLLTLCLSRLKPWAQLLIGCLCLIEVAPYPFVSFPLPTQPHAAYRWISTQADAPANAVLEIWETKFIPIGGEAVFASTFHKHPTLNGLGSFPPQHMAELQTLIRSQPNIFASPAFAAALSHYGARYVVLHQTQKDSIAWSEMQQNPLLRTENCFAPNPGDSAWPQTLCVAQINTPALQARNLILQSGWGALEAWGVWAYTLQSQAQFMAARQQDRQLEVSAFPVCIKNKPQKIAIKINDTLVSSYAWQACEVWNASIRVPANLLRVGINQITFSSTVAASPHDADPTNNDKRALTVGFTTLRIVAP